MSKRRKCTYCSGKGHYTEDGELITCEFCNGTGYIEEDDDDN
jgi:hypothetical protein